MPRRNANARTSRSGSEVATTCLTIGVVATRSGLPANTIRYYESIGPIQAPVRAANGYRTYRPADAHTLRFLRCACRHGFSHREAMNLIDIWHNRDVTSPEVETHARKAIKQIDDKLRELESLKQLLADRTKHRNEGRSEFAPAVGSPVDPQERQDTIGGGASLKGNQASSKGYRNYG